ncbi:hypothetical protein, conserved [Eimeria tenella]|uniref:Uncharacterized protein n=1 Tax=Eimeria tenella TaxID=5802 RepID=U6L4M1_EIMTE|nr:hypothetical protein, conserved [Eimeria tenella]CDJ44158.1 hypothetical protein, conserved [Eimeria tenella]|eukprot:XP_013234907.1 hypothetical protein, conserved [Eimeria tenella]
MALSEAPNVEVPGKEGPLLGSTAAAAPFAAAAADAPSAAAATTAAAAAAAAAAKDDLFVRLPAEEAALIGGEVKESLEKWGLLQCLSVGCFFCCTSPRDLPAAALMQQLLLSPSFAAFAAEKRLEGLSKKQ